MTNADAPKDEGLTASDIRKINFKRFLIVAAVVLGVFACSYAVTGEDKDSCASLARSTYSGDGKFVDVTFTKDGFVKGIVGRYVKGEERTVGHWECEYQSDEPVITFYSPAG